MQRKDVSIARHFADLPDPRVERTRKHALTDILAIALCAVICGADSWEEVEAFGEARADWLGRFLAPPNGIPSHDTFSRGFARIDPKRFGTCVAGWMADVCEATGLRHIAIDGKACRSAPKATFSGCLHRIRAWAAENRVILGQQAVADGSHEIAAIPELLRVSDLKGALVTIDAAGCQKEIGNQIRDRGGDSLLAVKGNRPALRAAVHAESDRLRDADSAGVPHDGDGQIEAGHGRREERDTTVVYDPTGLPPEWPDVAAVVEVGRGREGNGVRTASAHDDVTGLRGTAAELGGLIRRQWSIENELHWCLDVSFREDANRTAAGNAGADLGLIRRVAAALLKQDPGKGSIKRKRFTAALNERYLIEVLQGFKAD